MIQTSVSNDRLNSSDLAVDSNDTEFLPRKPGPTPDVESTDYFKALARRLTLQEWDHILQAAISQAKDGDDKARRWITDLITKLPSKQKAVQGQVIQRTVQEFVQRLAIEAPIAKP